MLFGVLQSKWKIVVNPCCLWDCVVIADVLMPCIILHNMLINDEQGEVLELTIELQHGIQMKRGLTFTVYIQGT
jgi:hypothetical protein